LFEIMAGGGAAGMLVGAFFGATILDHVGAGAIGACIGAILALFTILPVGAVSVLYYHCAQWLYWRVATPSQAERVLYRLEQHRNNPALDWLVADIDTALPVARRAAQTGIALRTADKDASTTTASSAMNTCIDTLYRLEHRCSAEAKKGAEQTAAQTVAVGGGKNAERNPCFLYASDAEEIRRILAVAEAVATFRAETLAQQNSPAHSVSGRHRCVVATAQHPPSAHKKVPRLQHVT
jgi:hypothetical protein